MSKEEQDFFSDCKARNAGSSLSPTTTAVDELDIGKVVIDIHFHAPLDEARALQGAPLGVWDHPTSRLRSVSLSKAVRATGSSSVRYVAPPPSKYSNELYHRKNNSMHRHEIILLGSKAIMDEIGHWDSMVDGYEEELTGLGEHVEGEEPKTTSERHEITRKLGEAQASYSSSTVTPSDSGARRASAFRDTSSMPLPFPSVPAIASLPKIGPSLSSTAPGSTGTPSEAASPWKHFSLSQPLPRI